MRCGCGMARERCQQSENDEAGSFVHVMSAAVQVSLLAAIMFGLRRVRPWRTQRGQARIGSYELASAEKGRCVRAAGACEIVAQRVSDAIRFESEHLGKVLVKEFREAIEGDAVAATRLLMKPIAPLEECMERRIVFAPDQRSGSCKPAAIADQIPVASKAADALECGEVKPLILEDFVGRIGRVDHFKGAIVARDGGAAESFQDADLDLVRTERKQAVEPGGEAFDGFPRKTGDEIRVDMDAGLFA